VHPLCRRTTSVISSRFDSTSSRSGLMVKGYPEVIKSVDGNSASFPELRSFSLWVTSGRHSSP
jgi:hypothetical protein